MLVCLLHSVTLDVVRPCCPATASLTKSEDPPVKFGNLYWQQTPDITYPVEKRMREGIELAIASEQHGFDYAWFAEQHFHNYGYSPNPLMIAQAVAGETSTIRVGMSVLALPYWNPVRLAEDIALLDMLSGGRLDVGIGRGFQHIGFRGFNIDLAERQGRFDECLDIMIQSWTTDSLTYEGEFYQFPNGMNVFPKPVQKPHPPIWVAVTSDENVRWVAKTDYRVFGSANWGTDAQAQDDYHLYLAERESVGVTTDYWSYALNRQCYVIPHGADYAAEKDAFEQRCRYHIRMGRGIRYDTVSYDKGHVQAGPLPSEETSDDLFTRVLFGYPEEIADRILAMNELLPIDMVITQMDFAGLAHDKSMRSQELFGAEVIPAVKKAIGL
jgi:alkanesulfonate monooxygenase SsuD/methylene tetrahydromethanopterin reductase-like flavin-dependent oxidoreductase (luciferase family)